MRQRQVTRHTARHRFLAGLTCTVGLAATLSTPAAAQADTSQGHGAVTAVADGDTIYVRIDRTSGAQKVRLIGIQAPEIKSAVGVVSSDQCGGAAATDALRALLPGGTRVQLRAMSKSSTNNDRLLRSVYKKSASGAWSVDVGRQMMASGMALWFPHPTETAHNREYQIVAEHARVARKGLWHPEYCGQGPSASVSVYVNWDAPGDDNKNVNGEFFIVRNHASTPLNVGGWLLRDSALEWFTFPTGAKIPAHGYVRVRVGKGTRTATTFYYGSAKPIFANPVPGGPYRGDAAYLFDQVGNLRTSFLYPCPGSCSAAAVGKIVISKVMHDPAGIDTARAEYVTLTNVSKVRVNLEAYYLRHRYVRYTMGVGSYLNPGASLVVHVGTGTRNANHQYMGRTSPALASPGKVELMSLREIRIACRAWGTARC